VHRDEPILAWGVATRALPGERESGDVAVVRMFRGGALAAAVDGLGHGPEAARAARIAARVVEASAGEPVARLFELSHAELRETRGAVMSLASFQAADDTVTWLGVGNVDGRLIRGDEQDGQADRSILCLGGIVGFNLPPLHPVTLPVRRGDTLIFATDGVRSGFARSPDLSGSEREVADRIMALEAKGTDDALVLVVRYLKGSR
jgi:phosphoserine phosphatase RsbX